MAKAKKKHKQSQPPRPAARKKAPRRPAQAPAKGRKTGGDLGRRLSVMRASLGLRGYSGADWGRLSILVLGLGVLVLYSFSAGGYFVVRRSYGELAILWLIAVGMLFDLRVRGRLSQIGRLELGLFAGYVAWIMLSLLWSLTPSRTLDEFVRGVLYVGGFGLFWLFMSRREWLGWMGHLFVVIAAIVVFDALLGKTFPDILAHPDPFQSNRINYPLTYWNTMAVMMIMAILVGVRMLADRGVGLVMRCLYAPALFSFMTVLWFTFSRAGILFLFAGLGLYLAFASQRLRAVLQIGLLFAWTGIIIAACYAFLPNMVASVPDQQDKVAEGHVLALLIIVLMAFAAISQVVIRRFEDRVVISRQLGRRIGQGLAASAAVIVVAAVMIFTYSGGRGGPVGFVSDQLSTLSGSEASAAVDRPSDRLLSLQSERFQEYAVGLKRFSEHPLLGTGAGTWGIAWILHRPWDIQVRDGHSWLFETMAELGIVGTLLLLAFVGTFFVASIRDLRFLGRGRERELYGSFFAASAVFVLHAMIDWDWEMPVIALAFFMFAGGLLRYGQLSRAAANQDEAGTAVSQPRGVWRHVNLNWVLIGGALLGIVVTILPLIAATRLQAANRLVQSKDYVAAHSAASTARLLVPWDADTLILLALTEQVRGNPDEAERLLVEASEHEPENDRVFRNLTRIYTAQYEQAQADNNEAEMREYRDKAVAAVQKARILNPLEARETGQLEIDVRAIGGELAQVT